MFLFLSIAFILILLLYARCNSLSDRIFQIERSFLKAESSEAELPKRPLETEPMQKQVPSAHFVEEKRNGSEDVLKQSSFEIFIEWLKNDWLMKLGAFLIILGIAWFVSYAFANNWIGPMGRIGLGYGAGILLLVLGRYRIQSYISQGSILMFGGALTVVLTTWAAREIYAFFTPFSALLIMFLASAVLGVISVVMRRLPLAYANVLMGAVAPLLTASPEPSVVGLFSYLLALSLGATWVAVITGWRETVFVSLVVVFLYSFPFVSDLAADPQNAGLLFSFVFTALFFVFSIFSVRVDGKIKLHDLMTAVVTGAFLYVWIQGAAPEEWKSMLFVAWTLVFAFGAFSALRMGASLTYFYAYAGVGVVFLGTATALLLEGPALTVAFITESALLLALGYRITGKASHIGFLALPSLVPLALSLESVASLSWRHSIVHGDSVVLLLLIAVTALLGMYFQKTRQHSPESDRDILASAYRITYVLFGFYLTVYVWLALHALVAGDAGTTLTLLVYTATGITFYIRGNRTGEKWQKVLARVFLAIVIVRLITVEVWEMELELRVITFIAIGSVLMFVAWLERNIKTKKIIGTGISHENDA